MKRSWRLALAISLAIIPTGIAVAQDEVPNAGFESWSMGEPAGWLTSGGFAPGTIAQSTDAHSGNYALELAVVQVGPGFYQGGFAQCPSGGGSFPISERWTQLRGYYKINTPDGDGVGISVALYKGGAIIGTGGFFDTGSTAGWQEFVTDLVYGNAEIPDSCGINITLVGNNPTLGYDPSTVVRIDDLIFAADTGGVSCPITQTGDVNGSGELQTSDIVSLVNYVLKGGPDPQPCPAAGDVNCDGQVVTSDIVYLVNTVLKGGPAPCDACDLVPGTWSCP
jgi:hypothetical protein